MLFRSRAATEFIDGRSRLEASIRSRHRSSRRSRVCEEEASDVLRCSLVGRTLHPLHRSGGSGICGATQWLGTESRNSRTGPEPTSARLDRGGRPFHLCLRIDPQFAGRRVDAKATAEGLANLLVNSGKDEFSASEERKSPLKLSCKMGGYRNASPTDSSDEAF